MPCVFPVLSIKVLGFATKRTRKRALRAQAARLHAPAWCCPSSRSRRVLLALRAAGEQLGWGFQLQSPAVRAALAVLFFVLGAQPRRRFRVRLPGAAAPRVAARGAPAADAFAVRRARRGGGHARAPRRSWARRSASRSRSRRRSRWRCSPRSASAWRCRTSLLALCPALARAAAAPRRRGWRASSRLLAFPMFATVAWLVWVLGQQAGNDARCGAARGAGALALRCGSAGLLDSAARRRARPAAPLRVLLLAGAGLALPARRRPPQARRAAARRPARAGSRGRTETRAAQRVAQGRPVFVDFTAAWCVTCQVNKRAGAAHDAAAAGRSHSARWR